MTYAKASPTEILQRIVLTNHGADEATLHVLPTLWFREHVVVGRSGDATADRARRARPDRGGPRARGVPAPGGPRPRRVAPRDAVLRERDEHRSRLRHRGADAVSEGRDQRPHRLGRCPPSTRTGVGTKAAFHYAVTVAGGASAELRLVLHRREGKAGPKRAPKSWAATGSTALLPPARPMRTSSTPRSPLPRRRPRRCRCCARRAQASSGASRCTPTTSDAGSTATRVRPRRPRRATTVATAAGVTSTPSTCSRCPIRGSTRGSPPGTSASTRCPGHISTRRSRSTSSSSCSASGSCTRTARCPPTSGTSTT